MGTGDGGGKHEDFFVYDWCKTGLRSTPFVTPEFMTKVVEISDELDINPDDRMAVMAFESWFDPAAKNPMSSATGLIQLMDAAAKSYGTTADELSKMSAVEQLDYVCLHFKPFAGRMKTLSDVYMAVLRPVSVGKEETSVLWLQGSRQYAANKGHDVNGDGMITKAEAAQMVIDRRSLFERKVN